jgi:hypothetical protein
MPGSSSVPVVVGLFVEPGGGDAYDWHGARVLIKASGYDTVGQLAVMESTQVAAAQVHLQGVYAAQQQHAPFRRSYRLSTTPRIRRQRLGKRRLFARISKHQDHHPLRRTLASAARDIVILIASLDLVAYHSWKELHERPSPY